MQCVAAVRDHAVRGKKVLDAALERGRTGPRVELVARAVGHLYAQAVSEFEARFRRAARGALDGHAAGIVRELGDVVAQMVADAGEKILGGGGAAAGTGADQKGNPEAGGTHSEFFVVALGLLAFAAKNDDGDEYHSEDSGDELDGPLGHFQLLSCPNAA